MTERTNIDLEQYRYDLTDLTGVSKDLHAAIALFPADQRQALLFGDKEWSLVDILKHFSAWADLTVKSTKWSQTGEPVPMLMDDDEWEEFNRQAIASRQNIGWDEVRDEFFETEAELLGAYQGLSENYINDTFAEFVTYCLGWDVVHYTEHLDSIKQVLKSLGVPSL